MRSISTFGPNAGAVSLSLNYNQQMMKPKTTLKSLGYNSDLIFNQYNGKVLDRGDYVVATTDSNPNFFWGNLLIYKNPPGKGDLEIWKEAFRREIVHPDTSHMTFGWDSVSGELGAVEEFIDAGFTLSQSIVLVTDKVICPRRLNSDIVVKIIESEEDYESTIQIQIACGGEHLTKTAWEDFNRKQMELYRKIINEGNGAWFGAYFEGKIVAGLGIFKQGDLGRYQIVCTHPEFQRRGICGTLVYASANYAFDKMGISNLVMIADENYHAAKIYESVGFRPTEKIVGVSWYDKSKF